MHVPGAPPRILVVDENEASREDLVARLNADGWAASGLPPGRATLEAVDGVDVLALDMPAGSELRRQLRRHPTLGSVPVIALGTSGVEGDSQLSKPVDPERLVEAARARLPVEWPSLTRGAPPPADPARGIDETLAFLTDSLGALAGGLPDLLRHARQLAEVEGRLDEIDPVLRRAQQGGDRIVSQVKYLKAFGPADSSRVEPTDVNHVLEFVLEVTGEELRQRATVVKNLGAPPLVDGNERQLGQIFSSLLINAAQAIPHGAVDENRIEVTTGRDPAGWATVVIRDTGSGIPPHVLDHIFDPFFSTKRGGGMGLGLFIVHSTVNSMGGRVRVESELGRGTTFHVALPPSRNPR